MRYRLLFAICLCLSISGSATAHTSVGGGSSGPEDPNADCLRWELVPLPFDAAVADGSAADAGRGDAGSGATVLQCAEHATMFGCACALGRLPSRGEGAGMALATAALAALVVSRRRRARGTARRRGDR